MNTGFIIVSSALALTLFYILYMEFMRWRNNEDARNRINVRVRNDPAPPKNYLGTLERDDSVTVQLPTGRKTFIMPTGSKYEVRWPFGAPARTQAIIPEIEVNGVSFMPIMLTAPDRRESASILDKLLKDSTIDAILRAWAKVDELIEKVKNLVNPAVLYTLLGIAVLAAIAAAGIAYYYNTQLLDQMQTIMEGLRGQGWIE